MGQLRDKIIQQQRTWIDPNPEPIPDYDYNYSYPITVYEAVHKSMEEGSTTLADDLQSIYTQLSGKQPKIPAGTAGKLMTWSGTAGSIGEMEVTREISADASERSNIKIPTEKAVGDRLDQKVNNSALSAHTNDQNVHVSDDDRNEWNNMTPLSRYENHESNDDIHVSAEDKEAWNGKASQQDFENHVTDRNNPHHVTAQQVGTYARSEIDDMFESVRSSFFTYKNIEYDERTETADLVDYDPDNWNPNYVLAYSDDLPEVTDQSLTYIALKPATDYSTNESDECLIYMKKPNDVWREVGTHNMEAGYLVIRYPDTTMCVWISGRFITIFSGSSADEEDSFALWRPILGADGTLGWTRSFETAPPDPVNIKGEPGYTPQKGIDYFDGASGLGVPSGGSKDDMLIKSSDDDYDTTWKSFGDLLAEYLDGEGHIHDITIDWTNIKNKPEFHDSTGDDEVGTMTQKAITDSLGGIQNQVDELSSIIGGSGGVGGLAEQLQEHLTNFRNPHHVSASDVGAASQEAFQLHTTNQNNPHSVTAQQIGLGNVNNTSDADKPISNAAQLALNELIERINEIQASIGDGNLVKEVRWIDSTCTLLFIFRNGEEMPVPIPIIEIFESIYFDSTDNSFVIVLPDGSEHRCPINNLVTIYHGADGEKVNVHVVDDEISADLNPNSIPGSDLVDSIYLRGNPTTTTQPVNDNSKRIATTEFVKNTVVDNLETDSHDRPLSANMGLYLDQNKTSVEQVQQMIADMPSMNVIDALDSTSTDSPLSANMGRVLNNNKAPFVHSSPNASTYGQATSELYGHSKASTITPLMDGTAEVGTDNAEYSRGDHRHPTDTSRAPLNSPAFTGTPTAPHPEAEDDSQQLATTAWVLRCAGYGFHFFTEEELQEQIEDAFDDVEEIPIPPAWATA